MKVLVIDDDPDIRSLISDALKAVNIESVCACNAKEALARFLEGGIGMMTLDMKMPGLSGTELHRIFSQEFGAGRRTRGFSVKKLPYILVITGYPDNEEVARLQSRESVVGVLPKPFDVKLLVDIAKDTLARAEADAKKRTQSQS
jgi:CheY-like chemotaxis protein